MSKYPTYYSLAMELRQRAKDLSAIAQEYPEAETEGRQAAVLQQASRLALRQYDNNSNELSGAEIREFLRGAEQTAIANPPNMARGATREEISSALSQNMVTIMTGAARRSEQVAAVASGSAGKGAPTFAQFFDDERPIAIATSAPSKQFVKDHAHQGLRPELPQTLESQGFHEVGQGYSVWELGEASKRIEETIRFLRLETEDAPDDAVRVAFVPLNSTGRVALHFSVHTSDSTQGLRDEKIGLDQSDRNGNSWQCEVLLTPDEAETLKAMFSNKARGPKNIIAFIDSCGETIFGKKAWHEGVNWRGRGSGGLPPIGPQFGLWNTKAVILLSTDTQQVDYHDTHTEKHGFMGLKSTTTRTTTYKDQPAPPVPMQFPDLGWDIPPPSVN